MGSRWWRNRMWSSPSSIHISEIYLYVEQLSQNIYWMLQKTSDFQKVKKVSAQWGRAKEKRERESNQDRTSASGRKLWKRKCFTHWKVTSLVGTEGALWSLREEWSNRYVEGKVGRDLRKGLVAASTPQPETLFCLPAGTSGGWVLKLGLQRSQRGLGLAAWRQLEGMRI